MITKEKHPIRTLFFRDHEKQHDHEGFGSSSQPQTFVIMGPENHLSRMKA